MAAEEEWEWEEVEARESGANVRRHERLSLEGVANWAWSTEAIDATLCSPGSTVCMYIVCINCSCRERNV